MCSVRVAYFQELHKNNVSSYQVTKSNFSHVFEYFMSIFVAGDFLCSHILFFRKRIIIKPIRLTHTWKANCVIFQKCHTFGLSLAFHLVFKINLDLSAYFYDQMNDGDVRGESVDGHMYTLSSILPISTTIHSTHIFDNVMSPLYHHFRALIHVNKTKSYRERDFTLTITSETPLLLRE